MSLRILYCVPCSSQLSVVDCDYFRGTINHPFVSDLETRPAIPRTDELHNICLPQNDVVSLLPVVRPAFLESLERTGTDKVDRHTLITQSEDYLCSPYIDATSHAGNKRDEAIVNGFSDFRLKPGDDLRLGHIQFFRAVPGEAASVPPFLYFIHYLKVWRVP